MIETSEKIGRVSFLPCLTSQWSWAWVSSGVSNSLSVEAAHCFLISVPHCSTVPKFHLLLIVGLLSACLLQMPFKNQFTVQSEEVNSLTSRLLFALRMFYFSWRLWSASVGPVIASLPRSALVIWAGYKYKLMVLKTSCRKVTLRHFMLISFPFLLKVLDNVYPILYIFSLPFSSDPSLVHLLSAYMSFGKIF